MPDDRDTWVAKLKLSERCFDRMDDNTQGRMIFLVLEGDDGELLGTAGIHSGVGLRRPFYNYKISKQVMASETLDITVSCEMLNLVNDFTGATELTSLYLKPEARMKPLGQFLSRSRFLVLSDFPDLFGEMVFAEIRGWLDEEEQSPFWQHIGRKFFNMPYKKADFFSAVNGSQFISDLMPRYPIYLNLIDQEAYSVVGKANDESLPAQRLLEKEGFDYRGYIDIFDAGPVLQCEAKKIASVNQARNCMLSSILDEDALKLFLPKEYLVSNRNPDNYRIALLPLAHNKKGEVYLSENGAEYLQVAAGDSLQFIELRGG
ncbi:MAG: arginine N-succinyltransferase [Pseudohongiellaceae bacterium]|jgi:arginine N-succinyltransferase